MPARLVVLASGAGTTLQAILDASRAPDFPARVVAVGTDRSGTLAEQRARQAGVPTWTVALADHEPRPAFDIAVAERLAASEPDLVVLAGYLKVLGPAVVGSFRIVNTHPSLLPAFPGAHAIRDALAYGVRVSGCTVHEVDEGVDTGPILAQAAVPVVPGDDEGSLRARIQAIERVLYLQTIRDLCSKMSSDERQNERGFVMTEQLRPVRRALVSVYDKRGLDLLAPALIAAGVQVVSTGSTAKVLAAAGVDVTAVSDITGFPEAFDGRVKTLHPAVHAGLLADLSKPAHVAQLAELGYAPFELVIVNLYPFAETLASGAGQAEVVEQIDIGGPAMIRAAAKNAECVAVVTSPARYPEVIAALANGGFDLPSRLRLAAEAFAHTAGYDVAIASWLANDVVTEPAGFPLWIGGTWTRSGVLRYGENPHQRAALYALPGAAGIAKARQHHGKAMSYNNYVDTDAARRAAFDHTAPCVAIIKHANPCGIAISDESVDGVESVDPIADAHRKAHACDPVSAFGGVIATNRPVTLALAEQISHIFTEVVIAPGYEEGAVELLAKKPSIRLLECPTPAGGPSIEMRPISGGLLMQEADHIDAPGDATENWTLQTGDAADEATLRDLTFAWRAIRAVKSNAILLATGGATVGVGMGQVNRVDAARLAVARAGERAAGSVAASDAFFPFPDGLEVLMEAGVRAVVEPGGSVRDSDVIAAAKEAGITLYFSGTRHFAH